MKDKYIIHHCPRDHVWIVSMQSGRRKFIYRAVAECFAEEYAIMLYELLTKK